MAPTTDALLDFVGAHPARPAAARRGDRRWRGRGLRRWARWPTTPRSSRSGTGSAPGSRARASPSTTCCTRNYERQVEDLLAGRIHAAWNSPLAWVRARRLAAARGPGRARRSSCATPTATSPRWSSCAPTGRSSASTELRGKVVGVGAVDSPQATLLPLAHLRAAGLSPGPTSGPALRRRRRPARRPHRRRARGGARADGRRGRRRLHDRRQPPAVHPGGHAARRARRACWPRPRPTTTAT